MSRAIKISEDLRPVSELKSHSSEVLDQVERTGRPVVLTRHGKGVAVLLSLAAYEDLEAANRRDELRTAIAEGEAAYARGEWLSGDVVDAQLARWESDE